MPISIDASETTSPAVRDRQAVAAVLRGETSSYRELVERYQRLVYAVAWSRLGDASLAEDAAQEAFIRAYRSLPLLGNGAKFSAWITTIARNTAISLGLKQRRELKKRARWALEQPVSEPAAATAAAVETCSPELLRKTLAELPDEHRESLAFFYIEGKRGAEAAAALGISEPALRMRLMRARAALRERLETRLGESLENLQPSFSLAPGVMGAIMTSTTAKAGFAASVLSVMGKILPFKFVTLLLSVIWYLPSLGLMVWTSQEERKNYREAGGFRPKLHREFYRGMFWLVAVVLVLNYGVMHLVSLNVRAPYLALGFWSLAMGAFHVRALTIVRNRYALSITVFPLLSGLGTVAIGLNIIPVIMFCPIVAVSAFAMMPAYSLRPLRMDYSLCLRAAQRMLKLYAKDALTEGAIPTQSRAELLAFARVLGKRFLAWNYRWVDEGLLLVLPRVKMSPLDKMAAVTYLRWKHYSWVILRPGGTVTAHCSTGDWDSLRAICDENISSPEEIEAGVGAAVERAWRAHRAGDIAAVESSLGETPDAEVFVVPTAKLRVTRVYLGLMKLGLVQTGLTALGFLCIWLLAQNEPPSPGEKLDELIRVENENVAGVDRLNAQANSLWQQARVLETQAMAAPADEAMKSLQKAAQMRAQAGQAEAQRRNLIKKASAFEVEAQSLSRELRPDSPIPVEHQIATLQQQVDNLTPKLNDAATQIKQLQPQSEALERQIAGMISQSDAAQPEGIGPLVQQVVQLRTQEDALNAKIRELTVGEDSLNAQIAQLNEQLSEL